MAETNPASDNSESLVVDYNPTEPVPVSPTEELAPAPSPVSAPSPVGPTAPSTPPAPAPKLVAQPVPPVGDSAGSVEIHAVPLMEPTIDQNASFGSALRKWGLFFSLFLFVLGLSAIVWKVFERIPVMATSTALVPQTAPVSVPTPARLKRPILGSSASDESSFTSAIYRTREEWLVQSQRMSNTHAERIAANSDRINGETIRGIISDQAETLTRREDVWYDRLDNLRREQCSPAVPAVSSPPILAPAISAVTKNDLESVRQSVVDLGTDLYGKIEVVSRSVGDLRQRLDANDGRVNALQDEMGGFRQSKPDPVSQNQTPAVAPTGPAPLVTSGATSCCGDEKPAPVQRQAVIAEERYVGVVIFNGDTAVGQPMIVPESSISRVSGTIIG